jgi:ATP-dependent helicase HrpA
VVSVRSELAAGVERVGNDAVSVLQSLQDANRAIANTSDAVFGDILDDVDEQMDRFVFPGFLTAVGAGRLDDVRRYLEGIAYRLRRLPENPDRDRERMAIVSNLEAEHDQLTEVLTWSPELIDVIWMLQELRVSLFAQPVGAKGSISEKRIRATLDDLLR